MISARVVRNLIAAAAYVLATPAVFASTLYVSNGNAHSVFAYATSPLAQPTTFVPSGSGGLKNPTGITFGPDGNLYVAGGSTASDIGVYRYNGTTGAYIDKFAATIGYSFGLVFKGDSLFVADSTSNSVERYGASTGAFMSTFVTSGLGGLSRPRDMIFGPDGNLYVSSPGDGPTGNNSQSVLRYSGTDGTYLGAFATGVDARGLRFGPDGNLYVASYSSDDVLEFDGSTGAFIKVFASGGGLDGPVGLLFGPDDQMYVSSFNNSEILQYDGSTGAFVDTIAEGNGLNGPRLMTIPEPGTIALLGVGLASLRIGRRRRNL